MKTAIYRVFRKNWLIPLFLVVLFVGIKAFSAQQVESFYKANPLLDITISECVGKSEEEMDAYLNSIVRQENGVTDNEVRQAKNALLNSINNCNEINQMISFAEQGEGKLPAGSLPPNYSQLLSFYSGLKQPQTINQRQLERYFTLQDNNIVPILSLCLAVIYWSIHYESEMYKYTKTVKKGTAYTRTYRNTLLGLSIGLLVANELFDLSWSGLLSHTALWSASLQSYRVFRHSQMNCTIFSVFLWMWFSKLFGIWTMTVIGERLAAAKKNLKDAAVLTFFVCLAFVFAGKALTPTPFLSAIQLGYVDWENILMEAEILLPLPISSFEFGVVFTILFPVIYTLFKHINSSGRFSVGLSWINCQVKENIRTSHK